MEIYLEDLYKTISLGTKIQFRFYTSKLEYMHSTNDFIAGQINIERKHFYIVDIVDVLPSGTLSISVHRVSDEY